MPSPREASPDLNTELTRAAESVTNTEVYPQHARGRAQLKEQEKEMALRCPVVSAIRKLLTQMELRQKC
jgi:predicted XRE-type DNA-binding protein